MNYEFSPEYTPGSAKGSGLHDRTGFCEKYILPCHFESPIYRGEKSLVFIDWRFKISALRTKISNIATLVRNDTGCACILYVIILHKSFPFSRYHIIPDKKVKKNQQSQMSWSPRQAETYAGNFAVRVSIISVTHLEAVCVAAPTSSTRHSAKPACWTSVISL